MDSIYSDIILIRWTFIFVYFVGRAIHKIWDPTKTFIHFSYFAYYLESINSSVHKPCPFYPQTTKFCANQTKWFHKYLRESNMWISSPLPLLGCLLDLVLALGWLQWCCVFRQQQGWGVGASSVHVACPPGVGDGRGEDERLDGCERPHRLHLWTTQKYWPMWTLKLF